MAYNPSIPPQDLERLPQFVYDELLQISNILRMVEEGRFLPILYAAPKRAREGMIAVADGIFWDPGAGKGLYEYDGAAWNKL